MNIEGVEIGGSNPSRFVAEISNNHNGDFDRAIRLIDAAKQAGADFVKFQAYTPDELVALRGDGPAPDPWGAQGFTMRTLYEKAQTPLEWFPDLFAHARKIGIVPFSSVFGTESLACLKAVNNPCYKIARLDNMHRGLVRSVKAIHKPVLISSSDILCDTIEGNWRGCRVLYCPAGYPTPPERVHLPSQFGIGTIGGIPIDYLGLSSHCLDTALPIAAVARGCKLIEMHMMLANEPSELEADVSLNEYQFNQMVHDVRRTEAMLT